MTRSLRALLLVLLLAPLSARAQAVAPYSPPVSSPPLAEGVIVGVGDVVKVLVWREKDLGGDFKVNEAGQLTLPLVGVRTARGIPWTALYDTLMTEYRRVLKTPSVNLTLLRPVYVFGEVTKPGLYLADPTMSLAGVVALAGGARPEGDLTKMRVVRDGQTIVKDAPVESQLLQAGVRSHDQIFIDRRGWFDRNSTFIAGSAFSVATIVVTILRR